MNAIALLASLLPATRRDALQALLRAMWTAESVDRLPHLGPVLGIEPATFERDLVATTTGRYTAGSTMEPGPASGYFFP